MYSDVQQLGLTRNATTDDILVALNTKYPAMFVASMFKSDYPNIRFASTSQRHVYTVNFAYPRYVSIQDHDINSGVAYFSSHDGDNYTAWTSTK